jgi:Zn2+/Cd2+-exporting ATPase
MIDQQANRNSRLAGLARLLREEPAVAAVRLPEHGRSVLVATLGDISSEELEDLLHEALALAQERFPGGAFAPGGGLKLVETGEGSELRRPTCPTAPLLWRWRELPLADLEDEDAQHHHGHGHDDDWREMALLAGVCALFGLVGWGLEAGGAARGLVVSAYLVAIAAGGWDAAKDSWHGLRHGTLDIHFLMLAAAAGSAALGAWGEGALLLFLFSAAGALEHFALHRTRGAIEALFKAAPKTARLLGADGSESGVPVDRIRAGDLLAVRPGDQFPVDAEVAGGQSAADESALTGEATPIAKSPGDTVFSGTLNLWGAVRVRALRPARRSALQKIIALIRDAQKSKAPSQRFTDRFGTPYTWAVLGASLGLFLVWWLGFGIPPFRHSEAGYSAFYRAMTLLVVASPCALVLSIPSAILAAIAWGARNGILFRGGAAVEKLAAVDVVCLDKTGTLTTGDLQVTTVESFPPGREDDVLALACALEAHSSHPIARAILASGRSRKLAIPTVEKFESLTGHGLRGQAGGAEILLGKRELLGEVLGPRLAAVPWPAPGHSEAWVVGGNLLGRVLLSDRARAESRPVLAALARDGLATYMLTGDREEAALAVAAEVGLSPDQVRAGLRPEDKVAEIRRLGAAGRKVAMVGDGVNDAPSLAAAFVSVAMGARASDAALEQSEVVLMNDRIENFLAARRLSRAARTVIRQNLVIALGTVVLMVAATLSGQVPLALGVFAHEGSTVVVCLNSLRLLLLRPA